MAKLDAIKEPIKDELEIFEDKFRDSMKSHVPLLDKITHYIVKRKGKQVRPMFVFLAAKICGNSNETTYTAASLVELLHTATLVHDDVVDDSYQRRGFFSINALWKNKIAVLVGDYLLSRGLLLSLENNQYDLLQILSNAVKSMSEGELLQIEKSRRLDIDESVYFEIIRGKTASLIASACSAGAASSGVEKEKVEKMRLFGEKIGMAFQIKDDLFEFGWDDVGKPLGTDIKEKKMTLPLIYALKKADRSQRNRIINLIKNKNSKTSFVNEVISFVRNSGGIEYASSVMNQYKEEAKTILQEFPASSSRDAMQQLVDYVIERKN
ncbi:MAG: polyprenyl synthetase family protein [Saprospiraceae bacterium]|nr:polyprenyl synthetase family protein [Saprospiraceae bacterium]